ncbi:uncharacterized protein LOC126659729 [Mercurialis annua]|uniref:uncharacterized protein LOC126659729 n=1 Tax=Mercurialis annua TaxID=3986 RepID=UPI00215EA2A7|nr:uncharacterized protein LOC126659729 [Mercurialis annua]
MESSFSNAEANNDNASKSLEVEGNSPLYNHIKICGIRVCSKVSNEIHSQLRKEVEGAELEAKRNQPKKVPLPTSISQVSASFSSPLCGIGGTSGISGSRVEGVESFSSKKRKSKYLDSGPFEKLVNDDRLIHLCGQQQYYWVLASRIQFIAHYFASKRKNKYRKINITTNQDEVGGARFELDFRWVYQSSKKANYQLYSTSESGPMFLKAVNCKGEYKDKFFIANLLKEQIKNVGEQNVVQVITDNAPVCRAAGVLIESKFPTIYWTPCVVQTLNLEFKAICGAKNTEYNEETYQECKWITEVANDAFSIRNFIIGHSMSNAIYNEYETLKMLAIAPTRFASVVIMLKRMLAIKRDLSLIVIIYEMLRFADTDKPCLHLIYDKWDSMIEKVKAIIYQHEKKQDNEKSTFYDTIHEILVYRWNKSNNPLHCLAHSLNPWYYTEYWIKGGVGRVAPHNDLEISNERKQCFRRFFPNADDRRKVQIEFAKFSSLREEFGDFDSIN